MGSRQRELPPEPGRDARARTHFTAADNETTEHVAVVNEAFVRRFFKSGEDPLDQHFGLDLPENVGTYRIVGIVRDAKFAGFALDRPARPMFYVPLAQTVDYTNPLMKRLETQSHFVGGAAAGDEHCRRRARAAGEAALAEVDPNLTVTSVRTLQEQVDRSFDQQRAVASLAGLFGIVALAARGDRALRRDGLQRGAAHERDRHPHGARRRSRKRGRTGAERRVPPRCRGPGARPAAGGRGRLTAVGATLRRAVLGSAGAGHWRPFARHLCLRRGDHPGHARGVHLADRRAPQRLIAACLDGCRAPRNLCCDRSCNLRLGSNA